MASFFADAFEIDEGLLDDYGAFNVSLVADLPLFVDPFLLFNSKKPKYQELHRDIIRYVTFLRDKSLSGQMNDALLRGWYCFPEVRQNWFGFSALGNSGRGLGMDFARALNSSFRGVLRNFGQESLTQSSHLEKVCLIKSGVGRDNVSDFTANLIKGFLCHYTQEFSVRNIPADQLRRVNVPGAYFDYDTETWASAEYTLPWWRGDFVILTPIDMLTRDENWINQRELVYDFRRIPAAVPDQQLRWQISSYFERALPVYEDREPSQKERAEAALQTIQQYPEIVDYYIRLKEVNGDQAENVSSQKVLFSKLMFNERVAALQATLTSAGFYGVAPDTHVEAHRRLAFLKDVIGASRSSGRRTCSSCTGWCGSEPPPT